jgi:hypothetical protein
MIVHNRPSSPQIKLKIVPAVPLSLAGGGVRGGGLLLTFLFLLFTACTPTQTPTASNRPTPTVTIYDDEINDNWTLDNSVGMEYGARSYPGHTGRYTLSVVPQIDYGKLFFTVQPDATERYLRKDIAAVAFWLYSGDDYMPLSSLAVAMAGSNDRPFWDADDKSVTNQYRPIFSETRLYFLDFNNSIPPRTWTEVVVWLDDLIYDPNYEYFTGVYLKNDEGFLRPFYIDNVRLIMTESTS